MSQLIKRLELINNLILLEETELLATQLDHLANHRELDPRLDEIYHSLSQSLYRDALAQIAAYLAAQHGLVALHDVQLAASRLELRSLEKLLEQRLQQQSQVHEQVEQFNQQHAFILGPLLEKVLQVRRNIAQTTLELKLMPLKLKKRRMELELERIQQEMKANEERLRQRWQQEKETVEEAERDEQEYQQEKERELAAGQVLADLSEEELKTLKQLYRKACKLCHPDLMPEALQAKAHEMMSQVNLAREQGDLATLRELVEQLEQGELQSLSETGDDVTLLQQRIEKLKHLLAEIEQELAEIQQDPSYTLSSDSVRQQHYFEEQTDAIGALLAELQQQEANFGAQRQQANQYAEDPRLLDDAWLQRILQEVEAYGQPQAAATPPPSTPKEEPEPTSQSADERFWSAPF